VIGYLGLGSPEPGDIRVPAVRRGLKETGYVEGQNVVIEYRWAHGHQDRLPILAADLVNRHVAVIVTQGTPATLAAKAATSTIPIIFNLGVDPVAAGIVSSLNHPGGNVTGIALLSIDLIAKRLELARELTPGGAAVALLANPTSPALSEAEARATQDAAHSLGLQVHVLRASTASEVETAFRALSELRAGAFVVSIDPLLINQRAQIVAMAARYGVPGIYAWREYAAAGGLMSYGSDLAASYRETGIYAGRMLKGEQPADVPVQQPTKFELVINLKTANALGLTIPPSLLARADEVIE